MIATLRKTGLADLLPMRRTGAAAAHVSAVIRSLCVRLGHFEEGEVTPERQTAMELGNAFEDAVCTAIAERYHRSDPDRFFRPGEMQVDELLGTPDLIDTVKWALIEIKLTKMSMRHDIESEKFWRYFTQIKAYCFMIKTLKAELHICHVNGDYRENNDWTYRVWEIEFTRQELEENWMMLLTHSQSMRAA